MLHVVLLTIQTRLETIASQIEKTFAIAIGTYTFNHLAAVLSKNKKNELKPKKLVLSPVKFPI